MDTHTYNIKNAKASFPQLLKDVASGTDVVIEKADKPLAKVIKVNKVEKKIHFEVLKGKVKIAENFDAPLPKHMLSKF